MFEAYAIGVTLKLNNLISGQLLLVADELARIDGLVATLNLGLKRLGGESAGLRAIAAAGNATNTAMERATRSAAGLERQLIGLKAAGTMPVMPVLTAPGGGGGRGPGGGGGGYGGGGGGHWRSPGSHGGNIHLGPNGVGVGTVGLGVGSAAFVPMAATAAMVWGGHALYESAKDLNTEMSRFKLFGLGDTLNNEAFKFVAGMKVYGSSQAENMKHFREAQGVFRESGLNDSTALEGAKLAAPVLAKIEFATASLDEEARARIATSSRSMLRYIEMSGGLKDAATFNKLANFGFKMVTTSGGTVDWEQMRQFKAISGISSRLMNDEAMAMAEPLIAELKGGGAGTGLRTAFNRLNGIIKIPNQVAHILVDQGLWDSKKIDFNSAGGIKAFKGNPFKDSREFQENAWIWYEKKILPMYERMKLDDAGRNQFDAMLFGGTGGRLFSQVRTQLPTMYRSAAGLNKALNIEQGGDVAKQALSGQEREFNKAWEDFKTQFGNTMLPTFSAMLKDGAAVLRAIGNFLRENEALIDTIKGVIGKIPNPVNPIGNAVHAVRNIFFGDPEAPPKLAPIATGKTPVAAMRGLSPAALDASAAALMDPGIKRPASVIRNAASNPDAPPVYRSPLASGATPPDSASGRSQYVAQAGTQEPKTINNTIVMPNGEVLAKVVTKEQSKAIGRPQAGTSLFDGSMGMTYVGAN